MMKRALSGFLALASLSLPAHAGVGKVDSPEVYKGLVEIGYSGVRNGDSNGSRTNAQKHEVELEYGLSENLSVGIFTELEREPGKGSKFEAYGLEAQYELTEQGDYWLGSAIKGEYARAYHSGDADELQVEMIAARSWDNMKVKANMDFSREFGSNRDSSLGVGSAVQLSYRINKYFTPGIEWHGEYGKLNELGTGDGHYVGPSVSGKLVGLEHGVIDYVAGYFWGVAGDTTDNAARLQLEYEFTF